MISRLYCRVVRREVRAEFEPRVTGALRGANRPRRDTRTQLAVSRSPQRVERRRRDLREQSRVAVLGGEIERLVRRGQAPRGVGCVHQAPRQQGAQARVRHNVSQVGDRERRFDRGEVLRRAVVETHEAAVGRECGADQRLARAVALRESRAFFERGECRRVAGAVLRISEANQQVGAFGAGSVERDRDVESDAVVMCGLGGCEVIERVIAGASRPVLRLGRPPGERAVTRELDDHARGQLLDALLQRVCREPV